MKLSDRPHIDHIFPFKLEAEFFFNDHYYIDKIEAVDAYITPCSIRMNMILLNFKLLYQKTVDNFNNFTFIHSEQFTPVFSGSKNSINI